MKKYRETFIYTFIQLYRDLFGDEFLVDDIEQALLQLRFD